LEIARYTDPAKRAIFFARAVALLNEASAISADHLLSGLIWEESSRAQTIFRLREYFPLYSGCPWKIAHLPDVQGPPLARESQRILASATLEAARLADYWIDTEHFLLGILRESSCTAAGTLAKTGLNLEKARRAVKEGMPSRPNYGPAPLWWRLWTFPVKVINHLTQVLTSSANSKL